MVECLLDSVQQKSDMRSLVSSVVSDVVNTGRMLF